MHHLRTLFSNLKLTIHNLPENAFYAYFMYSNISQYCSYLIYFNNLLWINKEEQENIKSNNKKYKSATICNLFMSFPISHMLHNCTIFMYAHIFARSDNKINKEK